MLPFLPSACLNKGRHKGESEGARGFIKRVERKGWRHEGHCKRVWQKSPEGQLKKDLRGVSMRGNMQCF